MIGAEYIIFGIIYNEHFYFAVARHVTTSHGEEEEGGQDLQHPQDPQTAYKEKLPQGSIYINPKNSSHGEEKTQQGRKHHEQI